MSEDKLELNSRFENISGKVTVRDHTYIVEKIDDDEYIVHLNDRNEYKTEHVDLKKGECECSFYEKRVLEDENLEKCHHIVASEEYKNCIKI